MKRKAILFLTALLLGVSGCMAPPAGLEKARFQLTSFAEIKDDDFHCQCKTIRLAGRVMKVTVQPQQTKVEILSLPVSPLAAKPMLDATPNGRFIAYFHGLIEPEMLKEQFITLGGILTKRESGKIDQADYVYPVVNVQQYRLWKLGQSYYYPFDDDLWGVPWGWRHRWYDEVRVQYYLY